MQAIKAEGLSVKYYMSDDYILKNVNVSIQEGEMVLITGPSGCGKSTLIYCLAGIIPHHITVEKYEGRVLLFGRDISKKGFSEIAKICGVVLQNPTSQIFGMTVLEDLTFGLENLCLSRSAMEEKLNEVLELVDLKKYVNTDPQDLSGGERQRLVIGSLLAMDPKILLFDEPTSNLDPRGTKEVLLALNKLRRLKKTIILVERKIQDIALSVDRIIALKDSGVVFDSSPRDFFSNMKLVETLGVSSPQIVRLSYLLREKGIDVKIPLTIEELRKQLAEVFEGG